MFACTTTIFIQYCFFANFHKATHNAEYLKPWWISRCVCNMCVPVTKKCMCEDSASITLHVCRASLSCILAGTRHNMCVYIPSTIQYMCRGSLLDGRDSCVTSFITQHTLSCRSKLAPPLTNSTTTSVLSRLAAQMSAVSPFCAVTDNVWVQTFII